MREQKDTDFDFYDLIQNDSNNEFDKLNQIKFETMYNRLLFFVYIKFFFKKITIIRRTVNYSFKKISMNLVWFLRNGIEIRKIRPLTKRTKKTLLKVSKIQTAIDHILEHAKSLI